MNLFADMGAQPATLLSGLVGRRPRRPTPPRPTSTITSPPASVADGTQVTLTGTATDAGGGVRRRRRGLDRRRRHLASRHRHDELDVHRGSRTATRRRRSRSARPTTAATSADPERRRERQRHLPVLDLGQPTSPRRRRDSGDPTPVEVGVKFKSDTLRHGHRRPLLQGGGQHRHAHRQPVDRDRPAPRAGDVHRRDRAPAGRPSRSRNPVAVHAGHDLRRVLLRARTATTRPPPTTSTAHPRPGPNGGAIADSRAAARAPQRPARPTNGVYTYGPASTFPSSTLRRHQLLGRRDLHADAGAGQRHGRHRRLGAAARRRTSPGPRPRTGGAADLVPDHAVHRRDRADADDGHRHAAGDDHDDHRPHARARRTRSASQAINPNGAGPVSAPSNAVTPLSAGRPGRADRRRRAQPASQSARVTWTAPASDGDSAITGYTVTPYIGVDARRRRSRSARRPRARRSPASPTARATRSGSPPPTRVGTEPASAASSAVTPQATIFDFATPADVDARRRQRRSSSA